MRNNKTIDQQQDQQNKIKRYFSQFVKYDVLNKSSQKVFSLIKQGSLKIQSQVPFPIEDKRSILKPALKLRISSRMSMIKPIYQKTTVHHQISNKNRRYLESLLQKYRVFETAVQKSAKSQQNEAMSRQIFQKISNYQEILRNSPHRLPKSQQEKQFLEHSTYNIRLAYSISKDQEYLKQQARKMNCSLHRKNKYYDCLDEIRKKINSLPNASEQMEQKSIQGKNMPTETSESRRKTTMERRLQPLIREDKQKGKAYLNYSKQVGVESKQIYVKQRGKVNFVKEVVHHWWLNNQTQRIPTVQSSLN